MTGPARFVADVTRLGISVWRFYNVGALVGGKNGEAYGVSIGWAHC